MTKINYKPGDGQVFELDVPDDIAQITVQFETQDDNHKRNERNRKNKSLDFMAEYGAEVADPTQNVEETAARQEVLDTLAAAVSSLNPKQQRLVRLRYYEGKTDAEIAQILGVSRPAITQQFGTIHKALKKFFDKF